MDHRSALQGQCMGQAKSLSNLFNEFHGLGKLNLRCVMYLYYMTTLDQRRYDMRHEMLTQRALFCHHANTKRGTPSQHFVTHFVPPLTLDHIGQALELTSAGFHFSNGWLGGGGGGGGGG